MFTSIHVKRKYNMKKKAKGVIYLLKPAIAHLGIIYSSSQSHNLD